MTSVRDSVLMTLLLLLLLIRNGSAHNDCDENLSCGKNEPHIEFPFELVKEMEEPCTYPRLCLSCTEKRQTMLLLPTIKLRVNYIDYESQEIYLTDPENCYSNKFMEVINFIRSYHLEARYGEPENNLIFFNCTSAGLPYLRNNYMRQDMVSCPIYMANSFESVLSLDLTSCTKMFNITAPIAAVHSNALYLRWPKPNCAECEAKGKRCKWKTNNDTEGDIQCFECKRKGIHVPKSFIFAATGSIFLGLVVIAVFKGILYFRKKQEDQERVDKFLEDYRAEKPARFTYADLKRITNGFKENLGEGAHGAVFRGKLSSEIQVAVKILNNTDVEGKEFINEVGIMGKIHHINVVRLLGFCAEGFHRALVYNFFPNGSLQSFIFPPEDKDHFLGWEKLQHISLGIAKGIEYLHQGCNHPIIHFDINPHNVLLDDNFTPKISDFGLAKLCSKNPSVVSMTAARGTLGYIAPEVFSRNFGNVSYKSDIYSYGMLLLEMVGGRKNVDMSSPEDFNVLYPDWIHNLVDGDVHIHVEDEDDVKIAKKLAIIGLWCIQWQPGNRPSIKSVIHMLETQDENQIAVPPNPFHSATSTTVKGPTSTRRPLHLEVIEE
ncbi:serine/threonine-protein kinase PBS1 [Vigna unguiculata]|uniref:Serine/threonine-protein kinase PBS1 n=1 Tax=Vigna unguiculata TaxID=3917 RepID=A0A4D6MIL0_VIGUN|nr:serine/threonine-protein kinase PBS1 [Vigna unguiculata]